MTWSQSFKSVCYDKTGVEVKVYGEEYDVHSSGL